MNRLMFSISVVTLLIVLVSGSVLALTPRQPQAARPLSELALQPDELPQGSKRLGAGPITADDVSHPLNNSNLIIGAKGSPEARALLFKYTEAYKVEDVVWDGQYSAHVGNYLYRYANTAQAQAVAQALIESNQDHSGAFVYDKAKTESSSVHGRAMRFVGTEGDAIHWLVGVKDNTLILLVVNGMSTPSTQQSFETLVALVLKR